MASQELITVTMEKGGESVTTQIPIGSTVQALLDQGHLRGIVRVNGKIAPPDTPLQAGDKVQSVPTSGTQG